MLKVQILEVGYVSSHKATLERHFICLVRSVHRPFAAVHVYRHHLGTLVCNYAMVMMFRVELRRRLHQHLGM
jgi:hypothetical protein